MHNIFNLSVSINIRFSIVHAFCPFVHLNDLCHHLTNVNVCIIYIIIIFYSKHLPRND